MVINYISYDKTHVSAKKTKAGEDPRVFEALAQYWGAQCVKESKAKGEKTRSPLKNSRFYSTFF